MEAFPGFLKGLKLAYIPAPVLINGDNFAIDYMITHSGGNLELSAEREYKKMLLTSLAGEQGQRSSVIDFGSFRDCQPS